jgi:putative two-component system hydrogenase maturation factor HypX/HoxX
MTADPRDIWTSHICLVVHPGIVGDRGAHSLDWAILNGEPEWGVTVVQAAEHPDAGPICAACRWPLRDASKSSLYRDEIARAAMQACSSRSGVSSTASTFRVPSTTPIQRSAADTGPC